MIISINTPRFDRLESVCPQQIPVLLMLSWRTFGHLVQPLGPGAFGTSGALVQLFGGEQIEGWRGKNFCKCPNYTTNSGKPNDKEVTAKSHMELGGFLQSYPVDVFWGTPTSSKFGTPYDSW